MDPVSQFQQDGTNVVMDRIEHLLVVIDLFGSLVAGLFLLGDNPHQEGHLITELFPNLVQRDGSILHHIMQESGNDRVGAQLQLLRNDTRHRDGMDDVRFATLTGLSLMCFPGELKSSLDAGNIFRCHPLRHGLNDAGHTLINDLIETIHHAVLVYIALTLSRLLYKTQK